MVLVENSCRWAVDSHNGISEGALGRPRSARQLHVCRLPLGGVCAPWWKIVLTLLTTCQHTREAASVCVCLCVCTHVNDHLSRLERIMRPEEPLQQGSAPSSFCSRSASLSRLAEVRWASRPAFLLPVEALRLALALHPTWSLSFVVSQSEMLPVVWMFLSASGKCWSANSCSLV